MRVMIQEVDYPEIYEITRVCADLLDENEAEDIYEISMESSEYVITLSSDFASYLNKWLEDFGEDYEDKQEAKSAAHSDWLDEAESLYRQIIDNLFRNGAVNLRKNASKSLKPIYQNASQPLMPFSWELDVNPR